MRIPIIGAALLMFTLPAAAQQRGQVQPLPDHWLTWDSVVTALALTDAQLLDVAAHYEALNAVMKRAAQERARMRQQMSGMMGGGGPPADGMRQQMQAMRATMDSLQAAADEHHQAIRALLVAEQQVKFDALPKPMVMMRREGMRRP